MPTDKDRQLHILDSLRQMVLDDTIRITEAVWSVDNVQNPVLAGDEYVSWSPAKTGSVLIQYERRD